MTRLAHSRTWYFLALSFPEDISPELLARGIHGHHVAGLGPWLRKCRKNLTNVLFDERRYLHPHAWPLLDGQSYLRVEIPKTGLPLQIHRDDHPIAADAQHRIEEIGLHLFEVGVAVLAIAVFTGPPDGDKAGNTSGHHPGIDLDDDLWITHRLRQLGVEYEAQLDKPRIRLSWDLQPPAELLTAANKDADPSEVTDNRLVNALLAPVRNALTAIRTGTTLRHSGDQRMFVHRVVAASPVPHHAWPALLWVDEATAGCSFDPDSPRLEPTTAAHTEDRWYPGTRCGFTRYSAVWMTTPGFFRDALARQHEHVYYSLVLHVLVQRRALLDIARESAQAAQLTKSNPTTAHGAVRALHARLLRFVGAVWVRQLSHQEQGIDIGNRLRAAMGLDPLLDDLRAEVGGLATWQDNEADRAFERRAQALGVGIGATGLYFGLIGANFSDIVPTRCTLSLEVAIMGIPFVIGAWIYALTRRNAAPSLLSPPRQGSKGHNPRSPPCPTPASPPAPPPSSS